ncbi:MAG: tryptophan synthase subunit alpha [Cyclobacteriaceae bacterium]
MNRLHNLFKNKKSNLLSVFYTAGFPKLDDTTSIGKHLAEAGADLIEIGIPFSDPIADGPVIQQSNKRALENDMNVKLLLEQVKQLRHEISIPILLMGYLNPVVQFGMERFCEQAGAAGVDGLILPDLPLPEFERDYRKIFEENKLSVVFLVSPTTSTERIEKIDRLSNGFIYAVSASSTTGARKDFSEAQIAYFEKLKTMKLSNPLLIGFGISNQATFRAACQYAAGAIVGSAFIKILEGSTDLRKDIVEFVNELKG